MIDVLGRKWIGEGNQGRRQGSVVFAAPLIEHVGKHDSFTSSGASKVLDDDPSCNL